MFAVTDDGSGVPEEMRNLIFEAFSGPDRGGRAQGPDLALPLVRRLVELHGGSMSVKPVEGAGLCIQCRLPRHAVTPGAASALADELIL